jgi:hypothetical protein
MTDTGNVNTQLAFDKSPSSTTSLGWGMTTFNASLAKKISLATDLVIQAQMDMFLSDTSRAVDITPAHLRSIPCTYSPTSFTGVACERTYFMAGVAFTPSMRNATSVTTETEVILARDQQGYVLNFKEQPGNMSFDLERECEAYGFPFAAFALCLRNEENNVLHARRSRN